MRLSRRHRFIRRAHHSPTPPSTTDNNDNDEAHDSTTNSPSIQRSNTATNYNHQQSSASNDDDDGGRGFSCSSYVPIAPLPIFHGHPSECPLSHLSRFRHVCAANSAPNPPAAIFPVTLDSHAALWYDLAVDPNPDISWHDTQTAFLNFFLGPQHADRARSDLVSLKQGDTETASLYYLRMQWILRKWPGHDLPEPMLMGVFVDGLREEFREWVVPQRPETLEEAVRLAENWERVRRPSKNAISSSKCGFCEGVGHVESECEVRRRMRDLWLRSGDVAGGGGGGGLGLSNLRRSKAWERSASALTDKNVNAD